MHGLEVGMRQLQLSSSEAVARLVRRTKRESQSMKNLTQHIDYHYTDHLAGSSFKTFCLFILVEL